MTKKDIPEHSRQEWNEKSFCQEQILNKKKPCNPRCLIAISGWYSIMIVRIDIIICKYFTILSKKILSFFFSTLTFKRATMWQSKTGIFSIDFIRCINRAWLILVFEISHFTTKQCHKTTKYKCFAEQIPVERMMRIENGCNGSTRWDQEDSEQL